MLETPVPACLVRDGDAIAYEKRTRRACALRVILDNEVRWDMGVGVGIAVACHGIHDPMCELHVPNADGLKRLAGRGSRHR